MKNVKPILLRILAWSVFLSVPLLVFPPFNSGKEDSGASGGDTSTSETGFPKKKPWPKRAKPPEPRLTPRPVKVPPKAIVVEEDPPRRAAAPVRKTPNKRVVTRTASVTQSSKACIPSAPRKHRLRTYLHGGFVRLRHWASPRAIWGSRVQPHEDLTLITQRWHHGTGTLWVKVRKPNGRTGWLPHYYIN